MSASAASGAGTPSASAVRRGVGRRATASPSSKVVATDVASSAGGIVSRRRRTRRVFYELDFFCILGREVHNCGAFGRVFSFKKLKMHKSYCTRRTTRNGGDETAAPGT